MKMNEFLKHEHKKRKEIFIIHSFMNRISIHLFHVSLLF